jgi:hypothetical protein
MKKHVFDFTKISQNVLIFFEIKSYNIVAEKELNLLWRWRP